MAALKSKLIRLAVGVENRFDQLKEGLRARLRLNDPLQVVTYRTYGTPDKIYVKGRALEDKGIQRPTPDDTLINTLVNMYRRFESDEVPGVRIKATFNDDDHFVSTDEEGYFVMKFASSRPLPSSEMWFEVPLVAVDGPSHYSFPVNAIAEVLIPPADAEYGIISDIDDTIVKTSATSLLKMARNTFFHNAHSRLPFAGVSEFYKALQRGRNGKRNNPFFYVSSSPWNLYELLRDFMDLNEIPEGPLLLRDFGLNPKKEGELTGHMGHKFKEIENILLTYPSLSFVLIGDSGQEDPVIYREVVRRYPGRILAIYIRSVQLAERERIAMEVANDLAIDRVEMIIVDNTVEAAKHASATGLIFNDAIPVIETDKQLDKGELSGKEDTLES